jgi:hypothetical protein
MFKKECMVTEQADASSLTSWKSDERSGHRASLSSQKAP